MTKIAFETIALADCLALAEGPDRQGRAWHSHVRSPGCLHAPFPGYALVIEAKATAWIADSGADFPQVDKDLVKMLHGADILDGGADAAPSALLDHLHGLQEKCHPWHHHMHFPTRVFNPHPGRWSISVESPDLVLAEAFSAEPKDVLREVEALYFANLEG